METASAGGSPGERLTAQISWVGHGLLANSGPTVVLTPIQSGDAPAERYQRGGANARADSGPLVVITRIDKLNSPDELRVLSASRSGSQIRLRLELRRFTGILGANVVRTALIEVELGVLPPGTYEFERTLEAKTVRSWGASEQVGSPEVNSTTQILQVLA